MIRKTNLELRKVWRKRIERQRKSELTVREFCQQEGVSTATFYAWRQRLRGRTSLQPKRNTSSGSAEVAAVAGGVPEAHGQTAFVRLPLAPVRPHPWIELVLAEGTIIRVPQQNMTALHTVLQALGGTSRPLALGESQNA